MNSLYNQLNSTTKMSLPNNVKQMISNIKAMKNPQAMAQQMINNNPQLQSLIQASNGDYERAFRNLCKWRRAEC